MTRRRSWLGRSWARRVTAAGAAVLAVAVGLAVPAPAAGATTTLSVAVTGSFDGPTTTGVVVGVTAPTWLSPTINPASYPDPPFSFTAGCPAVAPCPAAGATATWDFGDGTGTQSSGTLTASHAYPAPGRYTVRVKVAAGDASGTGEITALVSTRFGDVDASTGANLVRGDRAAIWAASALGLLPVCRAALPTSDASVDPATTNVNRGMFCPEPSTTYAPASPPAMPGGAGANGVTGADCLSAATACGLPIAPFLAANGGDPTGSCTGTCITQLKSVGRLDGAGHLTYDPTDCADNYTATLTGGSWTVGTGTEPGCVSRGAFFAALTTAVDGSRAGAANLLLAPTSMCTDGPGPGTDGVALRRAQALGLPTTETHPGVAGAFCDPTGAVSKGEAYLAVQAATGLPTFCPDTLRDLADPSLGHGGTANPDCGKLGALLGAGGPLVGDTSCPDHVGACFNPAEPLTRAGLATLLGYLVLGGPQTSAGLTATMTAASNPALAGKPDQLSVTVDVPAYYAATDTVTVTWPATAPGASSSDCPSPVTLPVGTAHTVTTTCRYTLETAGQTTLSATVTDSRSNTTTATLGLTTTAATPLLGTETLPAGTESPTSAVVATQTFSAVDPQNRPLTYTVASAPGAPGTFPQTGQASSSTFSTTATTDVGTVTVSSSATTSATVTVTANGYANGSYSFQLRACNADACTTRTETGTVDAVNDPPVTAALLTASVPAGTTGYLTITGACDCHDSGRPGYATGPYLGGYKITSLPAAGTLYVNTGSTATPVWAPASIGTTVTQPELRYDAAPGTGGSTQSFTYQVQDTGYPTPALWSADAAAQFSVT